MRQIILDTETTGRDVNDNHRVIEIGCIELINRQFTDKHFHRYINPLRESEAGALAVHGLTQEFLSDKPLFADIAEEFISFVRGAELIIHNAPFDVGFLNAELKKVNNNYNLNDYCTVLDTLPLARQMHPGQRNSLDALCKRYSVDNSNRIYHGALLDAELLGKVYLAMTGGQTALFTEEVQTQTHTTTSTHIEITTTRNETHSIPIILASEEELAAHKTIVEMLSKKINAPCLWEETDKI